MTQEKALAILKAGKNVFLTGSAGTGKTYVLNSFIKYMNRYKVPIAITASTGIAATHIKGQTIHSWVGMGINMEMTFKDYNKIKSKKTLSKKLNKIKILIIDEISMLHKKQLKLVNDILQYVRDSNEPFGGVQLILCGDFFQLPPIGDRYDLSKNKFAFMSEEWVKADLTICYLSKQYRQNNNSLSDLLNSIRQNNINSNSIDLLDKACLNKAKKQTSIRLYTHNADVDKINLEELEKIDTPVKNFWATTKGKKELVDNLKKSVIAPEQLSIKIGAKVMFIKNNHDKGYINGTLGKVVGFSSLGFPLVKTSKNKEIIATTEEWSIDNENGNSIASFIQIPLRLAWAITIHKSQGMTLDSAELNLTKTFEKGQGYVALSRLKSIEKMYLLGYNKMALQVDSLALKADKRFIELSKIIDEKLNINELESEWPIYIKSCDGLPFIK